MSAPAKTSTPAASHIEVGRQVLDQEIAGLSALRDSLGAAFDQAVDLLDDASGRIVVSGMGKSGHIARKIAATLASTGKPAHFVHPGEASHGDLGMITEADAVLALSKSGETMELRDLVAYTRRFSIPLLGITSEASSTLAVKSDVALLLPEAAEACPNGLAPTTSTTMMLALGDALAVALQTKAGFTAGDFRRFHPGGKLGGQLVTVRELMHGGAQLPLVAPERPMAEALGVMTDKGFGCVGVIDPQGRLVGVVTDGDLRRHFSRDLAELKTADVMTRQPKTVPPDLLAAEAINLMNKARITALFVVEDAKPIGLLHVHDMLGAGTV